jgi:Domain of unknown function (DUF1905)/Bacteriocin-protection, YdeI or OmpD-Associated
MYIFNTVIEKFAKMGEKTNWHYINLPEDVLANLLAEKQNNFRVKGSIDDAKIQQLALWPIGQNQYILPLSAAIRKAIYKNNGAIVSVQIQIDNSKIEHDADLLDCLQDSPLALSRFVALTKSWQNNFSNIVKEAKTETTKTKRIAKVLRTLEAGDTHENMLTEWRKK